MTKYPVSDKTSNFAIKPYIKKGYYPGQLISVKEFTDSDGKLKEGKYGHQWVMEFAIYKKNPETDAPIEPLKYSTDPKNPELKADVVLASFPYFEYKDKKSGEYNTSITPNSAITKILKALGWDFNNEGVDPEEFVGNWVEINVGEYEYDSDGEFKFASTIKEIEKYKGPEVVDVKKVEKKEPQKISKQIKHEEVNESDEVKEIRKNISNLEKMNKEGFLTDEGLVQAKESLEAKIEELKKK